MKKIYSVLAVVIIATSVFAQSPEKMSYQAVIRNSSDNLVINSAVGMQISILQGSANGTAVYVERHFPTTNANGLVSIEVGTGTVTTGSFALINWLNGPYFIKTETDLNGGANYTITGTSQLLSVPYALHARTAETVTGGVTETDPVFTAWNKDYNDLTNKPTLFDGNYNSLSNLPTLFSGSFTDLTDKPTTLSGYGITDAFDGNYNNLINKPTLFDGSYNSLSNLPTLFSGSFTDLTDKPTTLSGYGIMDAFDGNYNNLTNKPTLFDGSYNSLSNLPTLFSGSFTDLTDKPTTLSGYGITDAFDGNYNNLTNKPTLFDGSYNSLSNLPTLFSGSFTDLTDKPTTLAGYGIIDAFDGNYNNLTNKPTLFDGSYNSLSNLPTLFSGSFADLSDKPTTLSGYGITDAFDGNYNNLINKPTLFDGSYNSLSNLPSLFSGSFTDLTDKPTTLAGYGITDAFDGNYNNLTNKPTLFDGSYNSLSNLPTLFSGSFTDLTDKPTTIAGYGITNAFDGNYNNLTNKPTLFTGSFADLNNKPTTIAGYGITDAFDGNYNSLTNKPNAISNFTMDANSQNITNLADPVNAQDAVTKKYVDALESKVTAMEDILIKAGLYKVTDADNNAYNVVKIGTQMWMTENLKTTKFNDGTDIPLITDNTEWSNLTTPGYCWYNNDQATYGSTYGALYNWYTVNTGNLCPSGWHVPTDAEWTTLTDYLGGTDVASGKLKETGTTHWYSPNIDATNITGFSALPGGERQNYGAFDNINSNGFWWSMSAIEDLDNKYAWQRNMSSGSSIVYSGGYEKEKGFSIRCIRN